MSELKGGQQQHLQALPFTEDEETEAHGHTVTEVVPEPGTP